jgi:hypothetical protein
MQLHRELLSRSRLSVISGESDTELDNIARIITPSIRIDRGAELAELFGRLIAAIDGAKTIAPKTLDLIGHSTASTSLLRLGDWVIDAADPAVTSVFRGLADHDVLPRLGIHAVRLLACRTTDTSSGRSTVCTLANILGVEVYGTNHLLHGAHYNKHGFRDTWGSLLMGAGDLRRSMNAPAVVPDADRWARTLDLDALPASPLELPAMHQARHVATASAARQILQLIRRDAGAPMLGLLAIPTCELALPSAKPGTYYIAHVLLGGAFLRLYPDGVTAPGVVYPVDDAQLLRRIIDDLPPAGVSR